MALLEVAFLLVFVAGTDFLVDLVDAVAFFRARLLAAATARRSAPVLALRSAISGPFAWATTPATVLLTGGDQGHECVPQDRSPRGHGQMGAPD
jgi:hypothetical protein